MLTKLLHKMLCFFGWHKIYHEYHYDGKGNGGSGCFCIRCGKSWGYEDDWFDY